MLSKNVVNVIGCGLAGIETALFLAGHGVKVHIFGHEKVYKEDELEPRNNENGVIYEKLLMKELCMLGSPLARKKKELEQSGANCIEQLLVSYGLQLVKNHKNISFFNALLSEVNPFELTVIATGPKTEQKMFDHLVSRYGTMKCVTGLPVFPVVRNLFEALLCQRSKDEYLLSLTETEYNAFVEAIIKEALEEKRENEDFKIAQYTMEEFALHYKENLRSYAMMPQRVFDGLKPYATMVLKLTDEGFEIANLSSALPKERQERIFKTLTAFKDMVFVRPAGIRKGHYVNPIHIASQYFQSIQDKNIFFAGGIMGIGGGANIIASGLWCGMNVFKLFEQKRMVSMPRETAFGKLIQKITMESSTKTRPMITNNDIMTFDSTLSEEEQFDKCLEESFKGLERFKEEYKNGKYV